MTTEVFNPSPPGGGGAGYTVAALPFAVPGARGPFKILKFTTPCRLEAGTQMSDEVVRLRTESAEKEQRLIDLTFAAAIRDGRITPGVREQFRRRYKDAGTLAGAEEWIATAPRPERPRAYVELPGEE